MSGVNTRFERAKSRLSKTLIQISLWPWTSSRNLIYCGATQGEHQESGTYAVPCIQVRVKQLHLNLLRYFTLHPPRCLRCCGTVLSPSLATPPPHTHTQMVPCHWGVVNGGCGFMDRPHSSHPFPVSHPTVYKTSRAAWKKNFPTEEFLVDENQCLQDERVDCSSGCMRAFVWDFKGS